MWHHELQFISIIVHVNFEFDDDSMYQQGSAQVWLILIARLATSKNTNVCSSSVRLCHHFIACHKTIRAQKSEFDLNSSCLIVQSTIDDARNLCFLLTSTIIKSNFPESSPHIITILPVIGSCPDTFCRSNHGNPSFRLYSNRKSITVRHSTSAWMWNLLHFPVLDNGLKVCILYFSSSDLMRC